MLERKFAKNMPDEFYGLVDVWRWASMGGAAPKIGPEHPAFFYALKSSQHKDRDLVNMLLSDLSRLDFRQLFICHKTLFYETYRGWSESKKNYVVSFLMDEYAMDKVGAREALFGDEPMMDEVAPEPEPKKPSKKTEKKDAFKSPWGKPYVKNGTSRWDDNSADNFRENYNEYRKKNYKKKKKK